MANLNIADVITHYIHTNYEPVDRVTPDTYQESTSNLFAKLSSFYPFKEFTPTVLVEILHKLGFTVMDDGEFNLKWAFKVRSHNCPLLGEPK